MSYLLTLLFSGCSEKEKPEGSTISFENSSLDVEYFYVATQFSTNADGELMEITTESELDLRNIFAMIIANEEWINTRDEQDACMLRFLLTDPAPDSTFVGLLPDEWLAWRFSGEATFIESNAACDLLDQEHIPVLEYLKKTDFSIALAPMSEESKQILKTAFGIDDETWAETIDPYIYSQYFKIDLPEGASGWAEFAYGFSYETTNDGQVVFDPEGNFVLQEMAEATELPLGFHSGRCAWNWFFSDI